MPSLDVSPIEIRVRTIMELVTNYDEYIFNYTDNVGPLQERWKDICKDYTYSDLYEVAALCNVLRCNIRSLYPRIDYHSVVLNIFLIVLLWYNCFLLYFSILIFIIIHFVRICQLIMKLRFYGVTQS
jgi:hypothetical protein